MAGKSRNPVEILSQRFLREASEMGAFLSDKEAFELASSYSVSKDSLTVMEYLEKHYEEEEMRR